MSEMSETEGTQPRLPRKISLDETEHFEREGFEGRHYVKADERLGFSFILVDLNGKHPLKRMVGATRSYFVIDGEGTFTLNGITSKAKEGDFYIIPDGAEYSYQGEMTLGEFNVPGTTSTNAITLEPKK